MKRYLTFVVLALSLAVLGGCGKNAENGTGKAEETVKEQGGETKEATGPRGPVVFILLHKIENPLFFLFD